MNNRRRGEREKASPFFCVDLVNNMMRTVLYRGNNFKKGYGYSEEYVWCGGDGGAVAVADGVGRVGEVVYGWDAVCQPVGKK